MPNAKAEITELTLVRQANIKLLVKDTGLTRKEFAAKTNSKYATLAGALRDPPSGNIGDKVTQVIENALNKPAGWLDKDRRNGNSGGRPVVSTISMSAETLQLVDHPITKYQRDAIIALLFAD